MPDKNIELTRRKILASVGAVGAAGVGAGAGTTALYSDDESFDGNTLTAGELDLKMDWEEHYSYPQVYGFSDPTTETNPNTGDTVELDVVRSDPNDTRYVGLPDPDDPVVWANDEDDPLGTGESSFELYFQNTTIEAFPDALGGEIDGVFAQTDDQGNLIVQTPCETLADIPQPGFRTYNENPVNDDDIVVQDPGRTFNGDTYDDGSGSFNPVINLEDVKPGDYGELTFSAHLCDNDGYLWLTLPNGLTESENGVQEPEEGADSTPNEGELAENVETVLWYDDCDNVLDQKPNDLVVLVVADTSQSNTDSLGTIVDAANAFAERLFTIQQTTSVEVRAGLVTFQDTGDTNNAFVANPIEDISNYVDANGNGIFTADMDSGLIRRVGGSSPLPHALDVSREYLNDKTQRLIDTTSNQSFTDPAKEMLVLSDGQPSITPGTGKLVEGDGSGGTADFTRSGLSNDPYESDFFNGAANGTDVTVPNPKTTNVGRARAEVALVARDIDGTPFFPTLSNASPSPNDPESQDAPSKVDNPGPQNEDPAEISGGDGITIRSVVTYPSGTASDDATLFEETMMAYATGAGTFYNLAANRGNPGQVADTVVDDFNLTGGGETVIARQTLADLEDEFPIPLDSDPSTSEQDAFISGATHCFGFGWYVPQSVGNEIQGDSVAFDLGFFAEQARNNPTPSGP